MLNIFLFIIIFISTSTNSIAKERGELSFGDAVKFDVQVTHRDKTNTHLEISRNVELINEGYIRMNETALFSDGKGWTRAWQVRIEDSNNPKNGVLKWQDLKKLMATCNLENGSFEDLKLPTKTLRTCRKLLNINNIIFTVNYSPEVPFGIVREESIQNGEHFIFKLKSFQFGK